MGLSAASTGKNAMEKGLVLKKASNTDRVIALGGNPNVGKSTVFNELTGLRQHTGNWPGKTVTNAQGSCTYKNAGYVLVDLPGCYSLMAHSAEEEVARDFLCFGGADAVVIVCDATCLARSLNLVLQTMEITKKVVVCVNLMDEAAKKKIKINLHTLENNLGIPVVGTVARSKEGLQALMEAVSQTIAQPQEHCMQPRYPAYIEAALARLIPQVEAAYQGNISSRWLSLMLLLQETQGFLREMLTGLLSNSVQLAQTFNEIKTELSTLKVTAQQLEDDIVCRIVQTADALCSEAVAIENKDYQAQDFKIDRILTGRWTAFPIMVAALLLVFWLTIKGANYPSQLLGSLLLGFEGQLFLLLQRLHAPPVLAELLVFGVYRVLAWVVSVMLPPMAIFFPLFTLLEDVGFLPRIAFNLDRCFKRCHACGKQALTMCMGFGCNAAGVIGCRIIDSPRERLIAILTNSLVPCNGRFPILIAMIAMFFVGTAPGLAASILSAALLTSIILLGVWMTFVASRLLSATVLRGVPSSFALELPPYRKPQIAKVLVRSLLDRTLFVLARAIAVAAPAGLVIWLMANLQLGGMTLLAQCAGFLDPFAQLLGLDGVILLAFILGFPANEIVLPVIIMAYMAQGSLMELSDLSLLKQLLLQNGWTWVTAVSVMLFSLLHWPCSTTLLTIRQETQSWRWTILAALLPTAMGIGICMLFTATAKLFFGI